MNILLIIGKRIKALRKDAKYTQADLAEITGLSDNYIALLECGHRSPSIETLDKISKALNVHISSFFIFDQEKSTEYTHKQLLEKLIKTCKEQDTDDIDLALKIIDLVREKKIKK
ncbi:helix-turn-helix transcriptional regulator [candidate division TA06 bacterium]|nr:helix-turn-helix transcriptional regulator [candidate division TA06 bacterium]